VRGLVVVSMNESCEVKHGVLEVKITNIEKELDEVKLDAKDHRKIYSETIVALRENISRLTVLAEKSDERLARQDKKMDDFHININQELSNLRQDMTRNTTWYQNFFDNNFGQLVKWLFVVILVLLGSKIAGFDVSNLLK
jgi:phosphoglycerate-specific signal transduction histidine kinase